MNLLSQDLAHRLLMNSVFRSAFIAIPFPFAKDDHQFFNANYVKKNLGWLIREVKLNKIFYINLL